MLDQVITIHTDGTASGLQRKDGLDLRLLGHAMIERTSEILWDELEQKWYVEFKHVPSEPVLSIGLYHTIVLGMAYSGEVQVYNAPMYFSEYDEAVEAEIKTLDWARLHGLLI